MAYEFYLGIDATDEHPVTLALLEKETPLGETHESPNYHVRRVQEFGGDVEMDEAAGRVQDLMAETPYAGRTILVINRTQERGAALVTALEERGLSPVSLVVTGREESAGQPTGSGVPTDEDPEGSLLLVGERELVARLDGLYHDGRLALPQENSEEADRIAQGLQSYRVPVDEDGEGYVPDEQTEKRGAAHSRHVYSAALAAYIGEEHEFDPTLHLAGDLPTTGRAKRKLRPDTEA